ncbi:MAG: ABC transporter substrate-binding protein [Gammaproteobacteria bacterium]|nr:ABC transporter substrate-binding protein [Gammaproteobacteria bacterium]
MSNRQSWRRGLTTLAVGVALGAAASSPAWAGKADDTLNIAWEREQPTLDYYFQNSREGIIINRHVWDNLLYQDPSSGEFKGLLAESFETIDDKTFEFTLRQGVKFHNGVELTADDVVATIEFLVRPDTGKIQNTPVAWLKGAERVGERTVRITAKDTTPLALLYLSSDIPIYPKDYYAEVGPQGMGVKPVGTGPYKVVEVQPGKRIVFEKNSDYFEGSPKGKPSIGRIIQRTIPDVNTQIVELASGQLDWIFKVPADQAEKLERMSNLVVKPASTMRIGYLTFDAAGVSGQNPFQDIRVRRAVAHAVDRQAIADNIVRGGSKVVNAACYPEQFGCTDDVMKYDFDVAKAKALLAEAGYPNGFKTEIYAYRDRNYLEPIIGYLSAVGIQTDLRFGKYAATRDAIRGAKVPFAFMTWGSGSVPDVDAITTVFFGGGPDDTAKDPLVLAALKEGGSTMDQGVRKAAYARALKQIAEQAYWVPLFTYPTNYAMSRDLEWTPTSDEIPRFFFASWK